MTDTPKAKRCTKCGEVKPLEEFHLSSRGLYGRRSRCKPCSRTPETIENETRRLSIPDGMKRCPKCGEIKSYAMFSGNKRAKDGLYTCCKSCVNTDYLKNRDKAIERNRIRRESLMARGTIEIPTERYCPRCKEVKSPSEFSPSRSHRDGLAGHCRSCSRAAGIARERQRGVQPRDRNIARGGIKRCYVCGEVKPVESFTNDKRTSDGLNTVCRDCVRAYRKANISRFKVYGHNRRARERSLPNTWRSRHLQRCLEYWHYRCAACGHQLRDLFGEIEPHADHWIALTDPRPDNPGTVATNMICLCNRCNLSKSDKDPLEWLTSRFGKKKAAAILARINAYFEWVRVQPNG